MIENIVIGLTLAFWILGVISLVLSKLILEQLIRWVNPCIHALQRKSLEGSRSGDSDSIVRLRPHLEGLNEGRSNVAEWNGSTERLITSRPFFLKRRPTKIV